MDREFTHLEAAWLSAEALADEARRDAQKAALEAERIKRQGQSTGGDHITVLLSSAKERHEAAEREARAAFDKLWSARQGGNSAAA